MQRKAFLSSVALAIVMWPQLGHADLMFTLTSAALTTSPGGNVEFIGTLTNTGTTDVYLNGDIAILPYTELTLDDSPFFTFSPLFLSGGGAYHGPFFDVSASAAAVAGTYDGSFTIQGGPDANTLDNLAMEDFSVSIGPQVSGVPEPRSVFLLAAILVIIGRRCNLSRRPRAREKVL